MIFRILVELIPIYILVSGLFMRFKPLSPLTRIIGYSGRIVTKTDELRQEAYGICGTKWIIAGLIFLAASFFALKFSQTGLTFAICILIQLIFMTATIVIVELGFIKKYGRDIYGR